MWYTVQHSGQWQILQNKLPCHLLLLSSLLVVCVCVCCFIKWHFVLGSIVDTCAIFISFTYQLCHVACLVTYLWNGECWKMFVITESWNRELGALSSYTIFKVEQTPLDQMLMCTTKSQPQNSATVIWDWQLLSCKWCSSLKHTLLVMQHLAGTGLCAVWLVPVVFSLGQSLFGV